MNRRRKPGTGRRAYVIGALLHATFWLLSLPIEGQGRGAGPGEAQFVFVIDDSRSMRQPAQRGSGGREEIPDKDRLAVFSVRALLGVLDDRDWASVIRLNGARQGEAPPPLVRLGPEQRQRLWDELSLDGKLAAYGSDYTPCRTALLEAQGLLNAVDRPGLSQVVIFLTDGKCTPADDGEAEVEGVLEGFTSFREGRLQLFLLRFQGAEVSPQLRRITERSGGSVIDVQRGNATRILNNFAQALSRSQGYESQIRDARNPKLPGHLGARRVRLLAVAPGGAGEPLEIVVRDPTGRQLSIRPIDRYTHRFLPDGREYRFTSADYRPTGEPVEVEVLGAGSQWEVVALPEYHLDILLDLAQGKCGEQGAAFSGANIVAGSDLCAEIRLVNRPEHHPVGKDVTQGQLQGFLNLQSTGGEERRILANPTADREASFHLDLNLGEGYHEIRPGVKVIPPQGGEARTLVAPLRTLHSVDRSIAAQPSELRFGDIYPGYRDSRPFKVTGNFSEVEAVLDVADLGDLAECVALSLSDRPPGEPFPMRPGQDYRLHLAVADSCSREGLSTLQTELTLRFPDRQELAPLTLVLRASFNNSVGRESPIVVLLGAGEVKSGVILPPPGGDREPAGRSQAAFGEVEPPVGAAPGGVQIGFLQEAPLNAERTVRGIQRGEIPLQSETDVPAITDNSPLKFWIHAQRCCDAGTFQTELRVRQAGGGGTLLYPVHIQVTSNWWMCYRSWVLGALCGLLGGLLVLYCLNIAANTYLISRRDLVMRLVPLRWGQAQSRPHASSDLAMEREEVEAMIRTGLTPWKRLRNWFRANPLMMGLPNQKYVETVRLDLDSAPDVFQSEASLVAERNLLKQLHETSDIDEWMEGTLYAQAGSAISFFAVLGRRAQVGRLKVQGVYDLKDGCKVVKLSKGQRLVHEISRNERQEGHVAGWLLD